MLVTCELFDFRIKTSSQNIAGKGTVAGYVTSPRNYVESVDNVVNGSPSVDDSLLATLCTNRNSQKGGEVDVVFSYICQRIRIEKIIDSCKGTNISICQFDKSPNVGVLLTRTGILQTKVFLGIPCPDSPMVSTRKPPTLWYQDVVFLSYYYK